MKQIMLTVSSKHILLSEVDPNVPIFAMRHGKLVGMVVAERHPDSSERGWILRTGGRAGATGHHSNREDCLRSCEKCGYTFHIED